MIPFVCGFKNFMSYSISAPYRYSTCVCCGICSVTLYLGTAFSIRVFFWT